MSGNKTLSLKIVVNRIVMTVGLAAAVWGCSEPTLQDIAGAYNRTDGLLRESIILKADGTFDQIVVCANGREFKLSDRWTNDYRRIEFAKMYITRDTMNAKVLLSPKLQGSTYFGWSKGYLVFDPDQNYILKLQSSMPK